LPTDPSPGRKANVHTVKFPAGEIRGQVERRDEDQDEVKGRKQRSSAQASPERDKAPPSPAGLLQNARLRISDGSPANQPLPQAALRLNSNYWWSS